MQTRLMSFVEVLTSKVFGYLIGVAANMIVLPMFGYDVTWADGFSIALFFSTISLFRNYIVRRIFNGFLS